MKKRKLGIIGGSGLYKMEGFEKTKWKKDRDEKTTWSTPLIAEFGDQVQVVTNGRPNRTGDSKSLGKGEGNGRPRTRGNRAGPNPPTSNQSQGAQLAEMRKQIGSLTAIVKKLGTPPPPPAA